MIKYEIQKKKNRHFYKRVSVWIHLLDWTYLKSITEHECQKKHSKP